MGIRKRLRRMEDKLDVLLTGKMPSKRKPLDEELTVDNPWPEKRSNPISERQLKKTLRYYDTDGSFTTDESVNSPPGEFDPSRIFEEPATPIFRANVGNVEDGQPIWEPCRLVSVKGPIYGLQCLNDEFPDIQRYHPIDAIHVDDREQFERLAEKLRAESGESWGFRSDLIPNDPIPSSHV